MAGTSLLTGGASQRWDAGHADRRKPYFSALVSVVALSLVAACVFMVYESKDDDLLRETTLVQSNLEEIFDTDTLGEVGFPEQSSTLNASERMDLRIARRVERAKHVADWNSTQQEAYDAAVAHARSAERDGHEVYQPLRMPQGYVHEAELEQETFEAQLVDMVKQLEPTYLAEALDWARSDDSRDNSVLRPMVSALEKPIIKDLDLEARVRVERAVDAIEQKHKLGLPEKEQLRAHLMAPLLLRIRARVHSQVSRYVVKMARDVVLKAAKSTNPVVQEIVGQLHGKGTKGLLPAIPSLSDGDLKMINALHDLDAIHKSGVINGVDYNTQKAKLLSDWLKYSVNKAGGNSNEVLRIVFGGEVRGVTDTGVTNPSAISVHKKLKLEKGIASMMGDRNVRLNSDLVYQLIHSKAQWGDITGCGKDFKKSPKCSAKWREIKDLVQQYARQDNTDTSWGESSSSASVAKAAGLAMKPANARAAPTASPASSASKSTASALAARVKQSRLQPVAAPAKKDSGLWGWV